MAGGSRTTQTTTVDPEVSALNRLMRGEIERTMPLAGGLPGITAFRPAAVPGAGELDILGQIARVAQQPVDVAGFRAQNIARFFGGFDGGAAQPAVGGSRMPGVLGGGPGGISFAPPSAFPGGQGGVMPAGGAAGGGSKLPGVLGGGPGGISFAPPFVFGDGDPSGQGGGFPGLLPLATQGFGQAFERTVAPGITNRMIASGLGRSGALGEALSAGGAQFITPAVTEAFRGAQLLGRELPLPGELELSRLPTALSALEGPRMAQLAEESRRGETLLSLLSGFPQALGGGTTTGRVRNTPNILQAAGTGLLASALK